MLYNAAMRIERTLSLHLACLALAWQSAHASVFPLPEDGSTVIGTRMRTTPDLAAFANGISIQSAGNHVEGCFVGTSGIVL